MLISRRESGFTLIEIMVVLVIIAIITALIAPNIMGKVDEARVTAAKQDIRTLETALDFFQMENFRYPTTDMGLEALVKKPEDPAIRNWRTGGYLRATTVPKDPWGNEYKYASPAQNAPYEISSLGADGKEGGDGPNKDLSSLQQ